MTQNKKIIVIGVTGGSGSGKTSVSREIAARFDDRSVLLLEQDSYYKDQRHLTFEERLKTNYDHPFAFDMDLLVEHLHKLVNRQCVSVPVYDYKTFTRSDKVIDVESKEVIILEGILILTEPHLRDLMDIKVFVDTDDDVRIIRRIKRDTTERGRTLDSVINQYLSVVKPMHHQFVEPSKRYADVIIPSGVENRVAIDLLVTKINSILDHNQKEES